MDKKMNLVIDVDGVMTTGQFLYDNKGKAYKIFGPHDADGLKLLKGKLNIQFISSDKRGFPITKKRIEDMKFPLERVTEGDRYTYIKERYGFENTIFIGDAIFDAPVLRDCKYGIAPADARIEARRMANYVTPSRAAEGAVCDACIRINKLFFNGSPPLKQTIVIQEEIPKYKVCILAGGIGSRMGNFSKTFNKAMIPVQGKPTICHIIEKFPEDVEIVIAVGYMKETITEYLVHAYPKRKFTFVTVKKFSGKGAGPGYGLLECKKHLQCPFIFFAADTLIREDVPAPTENWFGIAEVPDTSRFCSASIDENYMISKIDDKVKSDNKYAFIGLAGVKDYKTIFDAFEKNKKHVAGEIQVSNGFKALMDKGMRGVVFTWFDTGDPTAYEHALENYPDGEGYQGQ